MITFKWSDGRVTDNYHSYLCHEDTDTDTDTLSRAMDIAWVWCTAPGCYRVSISQQLDMFIPPNAYIIKRKFPTLEAAKRAVERKVPPLVAVLKIRGDLQL